jgi:hypothetical protein
LFRYIRYNGPCRSTLKLDDETPAIVDDLELRTPQPATRLGSLDPETSEIVWQDEVGDTTES